MRWTFTPLLLTLLVPAPVWGEEPEAPANPLRAFVQEQAKRQAYGLYFRDKKVGWMVIETKLGEHAGKEAAVETSEGLLAFGRDKEKDTIRLAGKTVYSLETGEVLWDQERSVEEGKETVHTGVREGKALVITTTRGGRTTERKVPAPRENLNNTLKLTRWLQAGPAKGATFTTWHMDLEEKAIDVEEVYTFNEKRSLLWGGVNTEVFAVTVRSEGVVMEALVKADGTPLKTTFGGALEMRIEKESQARKLDGKRIDFISASSIKVDKPLGDPAKVEALRLEVSGLGDHEMPTSHRQRVVRKDGKVFLELKRDHRTGKAEPLSDKDRRSLLEATPALEVDDKKIRELAKKVVGDEKDPVKAARKIGTWVYRKLRKTYSANASSALEVLENQAGDCTEHTLLFVALARAAGIPAREVTGVAYGDGDRPLFGWHAWAEIHDGEQWVTVDPTWHQVYIDGTHITFTQNTRDWSWVNVLGKLSFQVVEVKKK